VTVAEITEEMVMEEMLAACEAGVSHSKSARWERAWMLCAGAYKTEGRFLDAKRCEDNIVTLRAFRRSVEPEVAS
jgi:hypothetical protein